MVAAVVVDVVWCIAVVVVVVNKVNTQKQPIRAAGPQAKLAYEKKCAMVHEMRTYKRTRLRAEIAHRMQLHTCWSEHANQPPNQTYHTFVESVWPTVNCILIEIGPQPSLFIGSRMSDESLTKTLTLCDRRRRTSALSPHGIEPNPGSQLILALGTMNVRMFDALCM